MRNQRSEIDLELLERLAAISCTQADAAFVLGVNLRTLERLLAEPAGRDAWAVGQEERRGSLLRDAYNQSRSGKFIMTIFLLKQPPPHGLGFRDTLTIEQQSGDIMKWLSSQTDEDMLKLEELFRSAKDGATH